MLSFKFKEVMPHAVQVIEQHGFINQDMAMVNGCEPTSGLIFNSLISEEFNMHDREVALADEIENWLNNAQLSGTDDFIKKCRMLIGDGVKSLGELGMIGSIVVAYQTFMLNKPMIDSIMQMEFSNQPLGALRSVLKDIKLDFLGTIYLSGGNVRELCFKTVDNQLVLLYKRKELIHKEHNQNYYYSGTIRKTDFKYDTLVTVLRNHRHDIKVK